jgi:orotidine-5'-phosphate decarboxylase
MTPFPDRLREAVARRRTPALVGIDPDWPLLPEELRAAAVAEHGETLSAVGAAYRFFGGAILDAVADLVPAVKFQSAFFEAAGLPGMAALAALLADARSRGLVAILDAKRNDIGNTAAAYAAASIGAAPLGTALGFPADALTVTPYLGAEGVTPFLAAAKQFGTGIFVLVRTSNPGAGLLQDLVAAGQPLYQTVADWVEAWAADGVGASGYGFAGAVVGATVPAQLAEARRRMPHAYLLVPGYGAQGGGAADTAPAFAADGHGALVNSSRGVIFAQRLPAFAALGWKDAIRAAARAMIADLAAGTPAGRL